MYKGVVYYDNLGNNNTDKDALFFGLLNMKEFKMSTVAQVSIKKPVELTDPPIARLIFSDVRLSWLWLILRVYVGYEWFMAGWTKLSNPVWFGDKAGVALTGFLNGALAKTAGEHPDVQGWYAGFLQTMVMPNAALWSRFVVIGEILVGVALDSGDLHRTGRILWRLHERQLFNGRHRQHQSTAICHCDLAGAGLENGRLAWAGSLGTSQAGQIMESQAR